MYQWLVFAHVLGVFGFLLAHGTAAAVAFALPRQREVERVRVLLDLSRGVTSARCHPSLASHRDRRWRLSLDPLADDVQAILTDNRHSRGRHLLLLYRSIISLSGSPALYVKARAY